MKNFTCVIMRTKKLPKQILDLAMKSLTVSRKFMEVLNLSEQKDRYHTIKDLEVKFTFQQTESDNCTPSGTSLIKNEPFVEILSYCVVRMPYISLWELLNKHLQTDRRIVERRIIKQKLYSSSRLLILS